MPNPYEHDEGCPICGKPDDKCECDLAKKMREFVDLAKEWPDSGSYTLFMKKHRLFLRRLMTIAGSTYKGR